MYTMLAWNSEDYDDTITEVVGDRTVERAAHRTSSQSVTASRIASWESDGFIAFQQVCGEDQIVFNIYNEKDGTLGSDELMFTYGTRASVRDYYELVGEAASCWYIERDSEPVVDFYNTGNTAGTPTQRYVYLKWCVQVTCNEEDSCFQSLSTWAWVTILSLFLFPAVLCMCCLCCMSNRFNEILYCFFRGTRSAFRLRPGAFPGSRRRNGNGNGDGGGGSSDDDNEVELNNLGGGARTRRNPPQPRINYIKLQTESTFEAVLGGGGGGGGDDDEPICAICLSELQPKERVKQLPCDHIFHASCVDMWGENSNSCPLCKFDVQQSPVERPRRGGARERDLEAPSEEVAVSGGGGEGSGGGAAEAAAEGTAQGADEARMERDEEAGVAGSIMVDYDSDRSDHSFTRAEIMEEEPRLRPPSNESVGNRTDDRMAPTLSSVSTMDEGHL